MELSPSTLYSYQVKARDTGVEQNETSWSTPALSATTLEDEPTLIFKDSFEVPDVVDPASSDDPTGWTGVGHPGGQGIRDEEGSAFSTIYGSQAAFVYSTDKSLTTSASHLTNTVAGDMTYKLDFNVGCSGATATYRVELLGGTTILGFATGTVNNAELSSLSESIVVEIPEGHANQGDQLAIKLTANSASTPYYDNVRLYAEPFPPAGTMIMVR